MTIFFLRWRASRSFFRGAACMALPTGLALAASLARGVHLGAGLVGGVRFGEVPLGTQLVPGLFPCVPDGMDCTKVIFSGIRSDIVYFRGIL